MGEIHIVAALLRSPHFRATRRSCRLFLSRSQQVATRACNREAEALRMKKHRGCALGAAGCNEIRLMARQGVGS